MARRRCSPKLGRRPSRDLSPFTTNAQRGSETVIAPLGTCARTPQHQLVTNWSPIGHQFVTNWSRGVYARGLPLEISYADGNRASGLSNHDHRPQVDGQPIRTRRPPHGTQVHMHRPLPCLDTNPASMGNILREETVSPVTRSKDVCDAITHITSCRGHKTKGPAGLTNRPESSSLTCQNPPRGAPVRRAPVWVCSRTCPEGL